MPAELTKALEGIGGALGGLGQMSDDAASGWSRRTPSRANRPTRSRPARRPRPRRPRRSRRRPRRRPRCPAAVCRATSPINGGARRSLSATRRTTSRAPRPLRERPSGAARRADHRSGRRAHRRLPRADRRRAADPMGAAARAVHRRGRAGAAPGAAGRVPAARRSWSTPSGSTSCADLPALRRSTPATQDVLERSPDSTCTGACSRRSTAGRCRRGRGAGGGAAGGDPRGRQQPHEPRRDLPWRGRARHGCRAALARRAPTRSTGAAYGSAWARCSRSRTPGSDPWPDALDVVRAAGFTRPRDDAGGRCRTAAGSGCRGPPPAGAAARRGGVGPVRAGAGRQRRAGGDPDAGRGVDSLNVAAAAAVAFWELCRAVTDGGDG